MVTIHPSLKQEYPFEGHFFHLSENEKLHYVDEGAKDKDVVIMLHGNPTWSFYYRNLIFKLKKDYRVLALDHLGCGLSSKPQEHDYTLANHIENLSKWLKSLNIKKFHLIVHDWGGAIGFGYAADHPDRIKSAIILNTAAFTSKHIPKRIAALKIPILGEYLIRKFNAFSYPAVYMAVKQKMPKLIKEGYLLPYDSWENRIACARFVQDIPMDPSHPTYARLYDIEKKLKDISCPKLILWGGQDFCFNDKFFDRWLEIYPEATSRYYPNAGHYILEDENIKTGQEISSFLSGIH